MKSGSASDFDSELDLLTHDHVFLGPGHDENARRTLLVVALTSVMMVAEIVAGLTFNSMALTADGFHMATHAGALGVAAAAYAFARRHAHDRRFSFGTGKVGDLAGFASALVLAMIALGIGVESALRLVHPGPVAFAEASLIAVIGLAVNLASAWLLASGHHADDHHHASPDHAGHAAHGHGHHHLPVGHDPGHGADAARDAHRHGGDNNLRSAFVHVMADALTSVLAIAALLSGRYLGIAWLDPLMGIVGAVVILGWSWSLLRDTGGVLLDRSDPAVEAELRARLRAPGEIGITDLHVWRVGPGALAAIVGVTGDIDAEAVRKRLGGIGGLAHLTVETRRPAQSISP